MNELNKVIGAEEKILWEGSPVFAPFVGSTIPVSALGVVWLAIIGVTISGESISLVSSALVGIGIILAIGVPLYALLVYKKIHYVITDKRLIMQGGLIGRDFKTVDFDQISNAEVHVGIADKVFGKGKTGSIHIATPGTLTASRRGPSQIPYVLGSINDPYATFAYFKRVAHDVKTDIAYPNQLRPKENPGYQTVYNPQNINSQKNNE